MEGVLVFIIEKIVVEMLKLLETNINKLPAKPTKEKEKEKEAIIYRKIAPLKTLVNQEGQKVSLLKGMYVAKLPTLIQVI